MGSLARDTRASNIAGKFVDRVDFMNVFHANLEDSGGLHEKRMKNWRRVVAANKKVKKKPESTKAQTANPSTLVENTPAVKSP
jgi:hypothetical protein